MERYAGKSAYDGRAIARILYFEKADPKVERRFVEDPEAEAVRYEKAREAAGEQLELLHRQALKEAGREAAAIFEAHRLLLEDGEYHERVLGLIAQQHVNAEYAVASAGAYFERRFSGMEDEYLRARAEDIQDVSERIVANLLGRISEESRYDFPGGVPGEAGESSQEREQVVLAAHSLTPSDTLRIGRYRLAAIVTLEGSANSHTAILARTMGIPVLFGIRPEPEWNGRTAAVDGNEGVLYVDPDEELLAGMRSRMQEDAARARELSRFRGRETVSADGRRIRLFANCGDAEGAAAALADDAEGIGLFRSEFLYLGREDYPAEEEQFLVYCRVLEAMQGRPVIFRTLDVGADKSADYFALEHEENPALGYRGIRICLKRPGMFKTQLRALFRAACCGDLSVMYPMITSVAEVEQIRRIAGEVRSELEREGIACRVPRQGVMIETPAAALISDRLAEYVDFFSIGTNDLTQYALAMDRQNARLEEFLDPRHEAVLRMIRMTVENAHRRGKPVGICGELAADLELTEWFLDLGVDELSVASSMVLRIREAVGKVGM